MFSSPAVRLQSQENSEGVIARKPGGSKSILRKAFQARDVNRNLNELNQQPTKSKGDMKTPKVEPKYPDWLLDACSYKEVEDTYEDILPKKQSFNCRNAVKAYTRKSCQTPLLKPMEAPSYAFIDIDPSILSLPSAAENLVIDYLEVEEMTMPKFPYFDL